MKKKRFVSLDKQTKKQQKAWHQAQRGSWMGVNPVTRTVESKKAYDRKRSRQEERKALREYSD